MDNKITTLLHIPWTDVVYKNIVPYLSLSDLFNLRSTSKSYKNLVDSYFAICLKLNLALSTHMNKNGFKVLFENCRSLKYLNLAKCNWITDDILAQFLFRNKDIVDINLNYCPNIKGRALRSLIINCKELTTLRLAGCEWLSTGIIDVLIYHQKNLQIVDLTKCVLLSERCILKFVMKFSKLKSLSLAFVPSICDSIMIIIAQHCVELEHLNIDGCIVTIQAIKTVIRNCPKLESIRLSDVLMLKKKFTNRT